MTLCLALAAPAAGQTIRGVVLEAGTEAVIEGAAIELLGPQSAVQQVVVSDRKGWFHIEVKQAGQYTLRPSHLSYTPSQLDTVSVGEHEIVTLVLRMGRNAIALEPLVVIARTRSRLAGFYDRMARPGLGKFVRRDYIERRVAVPPSRLLLMTPGVRLVPGEDRMSNTILLRGFGGDWCVPNVYLDGLPVPPGITTIDELTAADLIEGIEVYDSYARAPDIFHLGWENQACGVVAYWSRRDAHRELNWKKLPFALLAIGTFFLLTRMK